MAREWDSHYALPLDLGAFLSVCVGSVPHRARAGRSRRRHVRGTCAHRCRVRRRCRRSQQSIEFAVAGIPARRDFPDMQGPASPRPCRAWQSSKALRYPHGRHTQG